MADRLVLPSALYGTGVYGGEILGLPAVSRGVCILFLRENWPAGLVAEVKVEISFNGGRRYEPWFTPFDLFGGDIIRDGVLQLESWRQATWPGVNGGGGPLDRKEKPGNAARFELVVSAEFRTAISFGVF